MCPPQLADQATLLPRQASQRGRGLCTVTPSLPVTHCFSFQELGEARRPTLQQYPHLQGAEVFLRPLAAARSARAPSLTSLLCGRSTDLTCSLEVQIKGRGVSPKLGRAFPTRGPLAVMVQEVPKPPSKRLQLWRTLLIHLHLSFHRAQVGSTAHGPPTPDLEVGGVLASGLYDPVSHFTGFLHLGAPPPSPTSPCPAHNRPHSVLGVPWCFHLEL